MRPRPRLVVAAFVGVLLLAVASTVALAAATSRVLKNPL
jgi:hypothetical protein